MIQVEYSVIESVNLETLVKMVNAKLNEGWFLRGDLIVRVTTINNNLDYIVRHFQALQRPV